MIEIGVKKIEMPSYHLINHFLKEKKNYCLFMNSVHCPSRENQQKLNSAFQDYYTEIHLTKYISKAITRYTKDFIAKEQNVRNHYQLTLDKPLLRNDESKQTYKEMIEDERNSIKNHLEGSGNLLDHIESKILYAGLKGLTKQQFTILNLHFFCNLTYNEIALELGITKQAVSKTMRLTLSKLQRLFKDGSQNGHLD